jgi:integrase
MEDPRGFSHKHKMYVYIVNFVKYLAQERDDPVLASLLMYFRIPKTRRERKMMTTRIIVSEDMTRAIEKINRSRALTPNRKLRHMAFLLFLAFSGQRPYAADRITAGQFRKALSQNPPVLKVEARQDKIKMEHWVPIHPVLVPYLTKLIDKLKDDEKVFSLEGLKTWFYKHPLSMKNTEGNLRVMDMRSSSRRSLMNVVLWMPIIIS